jgi:hypothetical protein
MAIYICHNESSAVDLVWSLQSTKPKVFVDVSHTPISKRADNNFAQS